MINITKYKKIKLNTNLIYIKYKINIQYLFNKIFKKKYKIQIIINKQYYIKIKKFYITKNVQIKIIKYKKIYFNTNYYNNLLISNYYINKKIYKQTNKNKIINYQNTSLNIIIKINKLKKIIFIKKIINQICKIKHLDKKQILKKKKNIHIYFGQNINNKNKQIIYLINKKKNNHKYIGKILNLFHFDKKTSNNIYWLKNGWKLYNILISYIKKNIKNQYLEVKTPLIINTKILLKSGHFNKFQNNIYKLENKININILKPMNCPHHILLYKNYLQKNNFFLHRISEFGICFRKEISGSMYGIMRLKNFIQDDGHIFCKKNDIIKEIIYILNIIKTTYKNLSFNNIKINLSKKPNYIKMNNKWQKSIYYVNKSIIKTNINYSTSYDGAFYGPKLEFLLTDNINRLWQCGTIQIDFSLEKKKSQIIILHRAILGSIERFIGILLEQSQGYLPFLLSPIQIIIININNLYIQYIINIYNILKIKFRIEINIKKKNTSYKIKEYTLKKIPYIILIGKKEYLKNKLMIRNLLKKNLTISLKDFYKNKHEY